VTTAGGVKCWGYNQWGQLGDGTTADKATPTDVFGLASGVVAVATGYGHTCALMKAGDVRCWGNNQWGQLGDGTTDNKLTPTSVMDLDPDVVAISTGGDHTCALTKTGGVKCWGGNTFGQLGNGTFIAGYGPNGVWGLGSGVVGIAALENETCALTTAGAVKCWGILDKPTPSVAPGLASGVAGIGAHGPCLLTTGGGAKCWGNNTFGQLGNGTIMKESGPVDVSGLGSGVAGIAAGGNHNCARMTTGGVKCWGGNQHGELGDGTTDNQATPVDVLGL
jgi:alpha-tubulin suppressor-like RCC1 family protein